MREEGKKLIAERKEFYKVYLSRDKELIREEI